MQIGAAFVCQELNENVNVASKQTPPGASPTIAVGAASSRAVKLVAKFRFEIPHLSERPVPQLRQVVSEVTKRMKGATHAAGALLSQRSGVDGDVCVCAEEETIGSPFFIFCHRIVVSCNRRLRWNLGSRSNLGSNGRGAFSNIDFDTFLRLNNGNHQNI